MEKGNSRKNRACARECAVSVRLPDGRILTQDEFIELLKREKERRENMNDRAGA